MSQHGTRLSTITRELMIQWGETKDQWHDTQMREFERRFLAGLPSSVDTTVEVMEQLERLIKKIQQDCE